MLVFLVQEWNNDKPNIWTYKMGQTMEIHDIIIATISAIAGGAVTLFSIRISNHKKNRVVQRNNIAGGNIVGRDINK
jgi:hypothetical protein